MPLAAAIALPELAPVRARLQALEIAAQSHVDHAGDRAAAVVGGGGAGVDLDALDRGQRDAVEVGVAVEREAVERAPAGAAQSARPTPAVDQDQGAPGAQAAQVDRRAAVAEMGIAGAARTGHRQARQQLAQRHQAGGAQRLAVQHPRRRRTGTRGRRRTLGEHVGGPPRHRRRSQDQGHHGHRNDTFHPISSRRIVREHAANARTARAGKSSQGILRPPPGGLAPHEHRWRPGHRVQEAGLAEPVGMAPAGTGCAPCPRRPDRRFGAAASRSGTAPG